MYVRTNIRTICLTICTRSTMPKVMWKPFKGNGGHREIPCRLIYVDETSGRHGVRSGDRVENNRSSPEENGEAAASIESDTDENFTINEWARVMKRGKVAQTQPENVKAFVRFEFLVLRIFLRRKPVGFFEIFVPWGNFTLASLGSYNNWR